MRPSTLVTGYAKQARKHLKGDGRETNRSRATRPVVGYDADRKCRARYRLSLELHSVVDRDQQKYGGSNQRTGREDRGNSKGREESIGGRHVLVIEINEALKKGVSDERIMEGP